MRGGQFLEKDLLPTCGHFFMLFKHITKFLINKIRAGEQLKNMARSSIPLKLEKAVMCVKQ